MPRIEKMAAKPAGLGDTLAARYRQHETLLKYFAIGCAASAIDVVLFLVLFNAAGTSALVAHSVSVPAAVIFSFVVNSRHNFRTEDHMLLRLCSFVVVCIVGYQVGYAIIYAAMAAGLGANLGKVVSLPAVFVVQYVLNSRITFRKVAP